MIGGVAYIFIPRPSTRTVAEIAGLRTRTICYFRVRLHNHCRVLDAYTAWKYTFFVCSRFDEVEQELVRWEEHLGLKTVLHCADNRVASVQSVALKRLQLGSEERSRKFFRLRLSTYWPRKKRKKH